MVMAFASPMRALLFRSEPAPALEPAIADLVERVASGDRGALGELYDQHHVAVRAFASRLTGDASIAEDLVHDVFVALPRTIRRFTGTGSLRSFLTGVTINHARHHVRSAVRRRAATTRMSADPIVSSSVPSPERSAEHTAFLLALNRALDELPMAQRVAFVLCDVEERPSAEVAEIVGAPEVTVRTRLFHARQKLRVTLEREGFR
jgi:RNA polymerase sigma-70 factor, ECF subfamily